MKTYTQKNKKRTTKGGAIKYNKNKHAGKNASEKRKTMKIKGGNTLTQYGGFESKGLFGLTADAAVYILSNVVRLSTNMVAASIGYQPVNNNLGKNGQVDGSLMTDIVKLLSLAKGPINTGKNIAVGVAAQYLNILNTGMRVNAPMLQASLKLTIKIIETQLRLANVALQDKALLDVFRVTLNALSLVSDEIVDIVDPVATQILSKLQPIITSSIGLIFATIGSSVLSGAQAVPYAGTVLAALSSLDAITKVWVASINASTSTATLFIDGYSNTLRGIAGAIGNVKNRITGSKENFNNPPTPNISAPAVPGAPAVPAVPAVPAAPAAPAAQTGGKKSTNTKLKIIPFNSL